MSWTSLVIFVAVAFAYLYLLKVAKTRSFTALVQLGVKSEEVESLTGQPKVTLLSKRCRFIVTPVPGMELIPAEISGAVIKRVLIDEGLIEVIADYAVPSAGVNFDQTVRALISDGWSEVVYRDT